MSEAFVSLATNDDYGRGANTLGRSLKRSGTTRRCVLMVTSGVTPSYRETLKESWDELVDITPLDSNDQEKLAILARPELGCTFTKLRAWTLTQFQKCVFLDADTMVLQNVDELFERDELSAAPDVGWPDCFNSGVFVFKPSMDTYGRLLEFAKTRGSFDGGDQGLLNDFFKDWATKDISKRLPFLYNMVANITYSYTPAFMRYGQDVKIVHFLGSVKPWHHYYDESTGMLKKLSSSGLSVSDDIFTQMWWDLSKTGTTGGVTWTNWEHARVVYSDKRTQWEQGVPDYTGEDRFDNILSHMQSMMIASKPTTPTAAAASAIKPADKKVSKKPADSTAKKATAVKATKKTT